MDSGGVMDSKRGWSDRPPYFCSARGESDGSPYFFNGGGLSRGEPYFFSISANRRRFTEVGDPTTGQDSISAGADREDPRLRPLVHELCLHVAHT